jgi:hypothetical protein
MNGIEQTVHGYSVDLKKFMGTQLKQTGFLKRRWKRLFGSAGRPFTASAAGPIRHPYVGLCIKAALDCISMTGIVSFAAWLTFLLGS